MAFNQRERFCTFGTLRTPHDTAGAKQLPTAERSRAAEESYKSASSICMTDDDRYKFNVPNRTSTKQGEANEGKKT